MLCQFQSLAVLKVDHSQNMTGICFQFLNSPVNVKLFSYFIQYILSYAMLFVFDLKEMKLREKIFLSVRAIFYNLNRSVIIMRMIKIEVSKSGFCLFVEVSGGNYNLMQIC